MKDQDQEHNNLIKNILNNSDIENQNKIPFTHYEFCILGVVKNTKSKLTKIVIVNRWLWMTDDSYLRELFLPLKNKLENEGFVEYSPSILYSTKNKKETINYLKGLGIRHNENLSRSLSIMSHIVN